MSLEWISPSLMGTSGRQIIVDFQESYREAHRSSEMAPPPESKQTKSKKKIKKKSRTKIK